MKFWRRCRMDAGNTCNCLIWNEGIALLKCRVFLLRHVVWYHPYPVLNVNCFSFQTMIHFRRKLSEMPTIRNYVARLTIDTCEIEAHQVLIGFFIPCMVFRSDWEQPVSELILLKALITLEVTGNAAVPSHSHYLIDRLNESGILMICSGFGSGGHHV